MKHNSPIIILPIIAALAMKLFSSCEQEAEDNTIPWAEPYITSGHAIGGCESRDCHTLARNRLFTASTDAYDLGIDTVRVDGNPVEDYPRYGIRHAGQGAGAVEFGAIYNGGDGVKSTEVYRDIWGESVFSVHYSFITRAIKSQAPKPEYHIMSPLEQSGQVMLTYSDGDSYAVEIRYSDGTTKTGWPCYEPDIEAGYNGFITTFKASYPQKEILVNDQVEQKLVTTTLGF